MSQFLRTQAIILRRTNFGEADKIINFLTTDGQISALAKSIRKSGSKLAGALEPFSVVDLVLVKGRRDLYRVTSASLVAHYEQIITSYERLELGYYFVKIASRLSQDLDGGDWFVILKQTFEALNAPQNDYRLIKAWFNFQAARMQGEAFNFETTAGGEKTSLDNQYTYDVAQKSLILDNNGKVSGDVLRVLKVLNAYDLSTAIRIKNITSYLDLILNLSVAHLSLE